MLASKMADSTPAAHNVSGPGAITVNCHLAFEMIAVIAVMIEYDLCTPGHE
jgi:hypothetical protein